MKDKRNIVLAMVLALAAATLCGCFSIARVPTPKNEMYDDDGFCTNRVWESCMTDLQRNVLHGKGWSATFPTVQMRWRATKMMYFEKPEKTWEQMTGEEKHTDRMRRWFGWIPLTAIWITTPLDAAVDLVALPFDLCIE